MWKVFKVNKRDTSKTNVNCCSTLVRFEQTLHLVWVLLWPFFEKQVNARCGIGSISMPISLHILNAANLTIAKNSCQSYFKKFEVLFSSSFFFFLPPLHNSNDFSIGFLTFNIFNNTTLFATIQKTDKK